MHALLVTLAEVKSSGELSAMTMVFELMVGGSCAAERLDDGTVRFRFTEPVEPYVRRLVETWLRGFAFARGAKGPLNADWR
jgi:hypothetical protein